MVATRSRVAGPPLRFWQMGPHAADLAVPTFTKNVKVGQPRHEVSLRGRVESFQAPGHKASLRLGTAPLKPKDGLNGPPTRPLGLNETLTAISTLKRLHLRRSDSGVFRSIPALIWQLPS